MSKPALDSIVALVVVALLVSVGWVARGWREDAVRLDAERQAHADTLADIAWFDNTARRTLAELQEAKGRQTIIRREVVREVEKYRDRPCLDAGAVGLLNRAASGARADGVAGEVPASAPDTP